ncbi:Acyl-CoA synthetase (AMP-forming)/AMP-acid ligase II [Variovorax sp. OV700]|nr:Acyl-CoA synthetase (AMP-forming)/AMP-acid ligase II [Variovorax sp. OV700]
MQAPERMACIDETGAMNWSAFHSAVARARDGLVSAIRSRADPDEPAVVGVHLPNSTALAVVTFACATSGAAFELFPVDLPPDGLWRLMEKSKAAVVVTDDTELLDRCGSDVRFIAPSDLCGVKSRAETNALTGALRAESGVFSIVYSSGTSGIPKAIAHSYGARKSVAQALIAMGMSEAAVTLVALPMANNLSLTTWYSALCNGGQIVILRDFAPEAFCAAVETHGVTHFVLSPLHYRALLRAGCIGRFDMGSLALHISSSSRLAPTEKEAIAKALPGRFCEIYGVTEGGVGTLLDCSDTSKLHTVGKPIGIYDMNVIDDQGRPLPANGAGRIVGHSAFMMSGYRDPKIQASYWYAPGGDGRAYLVPGDVGYFDDDGYLVVLDRLEDTSRVGEERIYPSVIENRLLANTSCEEVSVTFNETPTGNELVVHWVSADDQALALARTLDAHSPMRFSLRRWDRLPRNSMGKVLRKQLA